MLLNTFDWQVVFTAALAMKAANIKSHHVNTLTKESKTEQRGCVCDF